MSNKKSIQLHIPTPCHEDWQAMTPCEQGKFCGSCQKTVIDFTSWSDKALYEFFSKNKAPVCGNFFSSQLSRDISIPYQSKSRLYRLAIACGLTLIFAQVPDAHAMVRQPIEMLENETYGDADKGSISGTITDKIGEPLISVVVRIYLAGVEKGSAITDIDGNYAFKDLQSGIYELKTNDADNRKITVQQITVSNNGIAEVNVSFNIYNEESLIIYEKPPIYGGGARVSFDRGDVGVQYRPTMDMTKLVAKQAPAEKKKKGFFSFLKRKKKNNEQ